MRVVAGHQVSQGEHFAFEGADLIDEQMRGFVVSTPTVTFENDFVIDLGGREVQLKHLGWGNTKGDIVL